jgi:acetylornithine/N-succinyldiaminopimelate aminotransferase
VIINDQNLMTLIPRPPCVMSHGQGSWLWDEAGKQYLDFIQGWAVNALGHAPPELTETIAKQAAQLLTASPAYFTRPLLDLSHELCLATGMDRVFLANSGAESNDAAIKLARKWAQANRPGAYRLITTHDSFHGRTLACVAASGKPGWEHSFPPMPQGFDKVPYGDVEAVAQAITAETAAVMVEPIQGEAGVVLPPVGYLLALRELTHSRGILLIFDEIQTGFGRTGNFLRGQSEGVTPDILTLGKGLGGGVPIGAILAQEHAATFVRGDHGGTYTGNPLTASCALEVLRTVNQPAFLDNVTAQGKLLCETLEWLAEHSPVEITNIRGAGLLWAFDLAQPLAEATRDRALENGLLVNAPRPHVIRLMPQLRVTSSEIRTMAERMLHALHLAVGQNAAA